MHIQAISAGASTHLVLIGSVFVVSGFLGLAIATMVADIDSVGATVEFVLFDAFSAAPLSPTVGGLAAAVSGLTIDHPFDPGLEGSLLFRDSVLFC